MTATGGATDNKGPKKKIGPYRMSDRQEAFCQAYAAAATKPGGVAYAYQAAQAAGFSPGGCRSYGCKLLKLAKIRARIREIERANLAACGYDPDAMGAIIMRELTRIALSDISDVMRIVGPDDPAREDALSFDASLDGGQRILDFGEPLLSPIAAITPTDELPEGVSAAIKSYQARYDRKSRETRIDVVMHDKMAALRSLAEACGVIKTRAEVDVTVTPSAILAAVGERRSSPASPDTSATALSDTPSAPIGGCGDGE